MLRSRSSLAPTAWATSTCPGHWHDLRSNVSNTVITPYKKLQTYRFPLNGEATTGAMAAAARMIARQNLMRIMMNKEISFAINASYVSCWCVGVSTSLKKLETVNGSFIVIKFLRSPIGPIIAPIIVLVLTCTDTRTGFSWGYKMVDVQRVRSWRFSYLILTPRKFLIGVSESEET